MADQIGVPRKGKRRLAVQLGAIEITTEELVRRMMQKRRAVP